MYKNYIVSSGVTSTGIKLYDDYLDVYGTINSTTCDGISTLTIYNGGKASNTFLKDGFMHISSGGAATKTSIASDGNLRVHKQGEANHTTVSSKGQLDVIGTVNETLIDGGYLYIHSNGRANDTKVNSGICAVQPGGYAQNIQVSSGSLLMYGTASNVSLLSKGNLGIFTGTVNNVYVKNGGCITFADMSSLAAEASSAAAIEGENLEEQGITFKPGVITSAIISSGGTAICQYNGTMNDTTINNNGSMLVDNATANATTIKYGGFIQIQGNGLANQTGVYGSACVALGGMANSTTIYSGGSLGVNGSAIHNIINGGQLFCGEYEELGSACIEESIINYGGTVLIGGWSEDSCHNILYTIGFAKNTEINSGGSFLLQSGSFHSGTMEITKGASVIVNEGANIDFTVAEQIDPSTALINNWSLISGREKANYTITIDGKLSDGTYVLADNATNFNNTITVKNTNGTRLGYLSVGGSLQSGKYNYTLRKDDSRLSLVIGNPGAEPGTDDNWNDMKSKGANGQIGNFDSFEIGASFTDEIGKDDPVDYLEFKLEYAANVVFSVTSENTAKFSINQLQCKTTKNIKTYSLKTLQSTTLQPNKTSTTKSLMLNAGTYYIGMTVGNKKSPNKQYSITVDKSTVVYDKGDNSDDWTDMKTMGELSDEFQVYGDISNSSLDNYLVDGWVGFGDIVDYIQFDLKNAANISFTVEGSDTTKITIYQLQKKNSRTGNSYSLKSLQCTTLKKNIACDTKSLELNAGTYYLAIESTNKKNGDANYSLKLNENTTIYDKGDNSDDNWQKTGKILENDSVINDWLGVGDTIDFGMFIPEKDCMGNFSLCDVGANVKLVLYTEYNGKLKSLKSVSATAKKSAETGDLVLNAGKTYYVGLESKAKSTDYKLEIENKGEFNWDNNSLENADDLSDGYIGTLTKNKEGDMWDYFSVNELDNFHLEVNSGSVKLTFLDEKGKSIKSNGLLNAMDTSVKAASNLTLKAGDKTWNSVSCIALDEKVKYIKIGANTSGLCSYTLASK